MRISNLGKPGASLLFVFFFYMVQFENANMKRSIPPPQQRRTFSVPFQQIEPQLEEDVETREDTKQEESSDNTLQSRHKRASRLHSVARARQHTPVRASRTHAGLFVHRLPPERTAKTRRGKLLHTNKSGENTDATTFGTS